MKLIDLSHAMVDGGPSFPGDPALSIKPFFTIAEKRVNVSVISMGSHQATHLDAPFHFYEDGRTVEQIPLERFFGPAHLIDFGNLKPKTPLTVPMFQKFDRLFKPGARIIYRTGWHRRFGREGYFTEFPTLTIEAAAWIARKKIGLLGMDTPTPSTDWYEVHRILLKKSPAIVIVENLTSLNKLPEKFTLAAFPLKLAGRDGAPCRAVAIVQ